ncbi:metallophosphoesterase [Pelistega europaea]|uniref:Metallophosphoesterase n=1 Tax=Pelistega europaea TaxID=106147 RepID=A0A7Y4L9P0_9BURK|nr:metallophosphoesterase [Pelistega europaea]NOL49494.1 metallophosphoesterase [Pelistega europaea]
MLGLFFYAQLFLGLYIAWRIVYPLPVTKGVRIFFFLLVLMVSMLLVIEQRILGRAFISAQPLWFSWVAGCAYVAFILLGVLTLFSDAIFLVKRWLFRRPRMWGQHWRLGILLVTAILTTVGVQQATKIPETRHVEITIRDLPESLNGFTIVQLTDLHVSFMMRGAWLRQIVDKVNALKPDVILLTGDMVDGYVPDKIQDIAPLADLKALYGVYGITGNHEYYFDAPAWVEHFQRLGVTMLNNAHVVLNYHGTPLKIAGVNDPAALQFGLEGPDLDKALHHAVGMYVLAEDMQSMTTILMDHRPINAYDNIAKGVDLQLSGHTHGGSVWGLTEIVKQVNNGFVSGLYNLDDKGWMYLSNGAGLWNGFPVRLGVPSEISVIVLRH